ncbi:MAG: DNA repair protein RecO [Acidobacteriota bacterium]|nr:DNA repair protein RecO [Acidobacteriota bacterium]
MKEFRDDAFVLRTYKSGEADRVVVLYTKEHGKVRVLAKGARKPSSRLGATLETLGAVRVDVVKSRGAFYVARHVQHLDALRTLRSSYARISAGYAVVEVVDAIPAEETADEAIFELLARVLATLNDERFHPELVPASFYLRLLALDGSAPVLDECVLCGSPGPLVAFDAVAGGALCASDRRGIALSHDALTLLQRITGGDLAGVLSETDAPGTGEVMALTQEAIENHFGRRLRAPRATAPVTPLLDH